jgi:hypothetical protein
MWAESNGRMYLSSPLHFLQGRSYTHYFHQAIMCLPFAIVVIYLNWAAQRRTGHAIHVGTHRIAPATDLLVVNGTPWEEMQPRAPFSFEKVEALAKWLT